MLESFMRRLSRKFGNIVRIFYAEDVDEGILDSEKNLYKRGIFRHAKTIEEFVNGDSTSADLADAIAKIGRLAYAGGPPATRCAGDFLGNFAQLLASDEVKSDAKIAIMKTLSIITLGHLEHQDRCEALGIIDDVIGILESKATPEAMLLWASYCLHNMIVGNISCMECVANIPAIHNTLAHASELDWNAFARNYASDIMKLIGLTAKIPVLLQSDAKILSSNDIPKILQSIGSIS